MATDPTIEAGAGGIDTRARAMSSPSVTPGQRTQNSAAARPGGANPVVALETGGSGTGVHPLSGEASAPVQAEGADMVARLLAGRPFYISHRMGGSEYPEFTRRGLDASLRAGFTALEVSVRPREPCGEPTIRFGRLRGRRCARCVRKRGRSCA